MSSNSLSCLVQRELAAQVLLHLHRHDAVEVLGLAEDVDQDGLGVRPSAKPVDRRRLHVRVVEGHIGLIPRIPLSHGSLVLTQLGSLLLLAAGLPPLSHFRRPVHARVRAAPEHPLHLLVRGSIPLRQGGDRLRRGFRGGHIGRHWLRRHILSASHRRHILLHLIRQLLGPRKVLIFDALIGPGTVLDNVLRHGCGYAPGGRQLVDIELRFVQRRPHGGDVLRPEPPVKPLLKPVLHLRGW